MDKICLDKVRMGFDWNPNYSFKEFLSRNKTCDYEKAYCIFREIEDRYLQEKYEKERR